MELYKSRGIRVNRGSIRVISIFTKIINPPQGRKVMTKKELKSIETLERRASEKLEESERVFGKMNTVTISDRAYWAGIRAALETLKEGKL